MKDDFKINLPDLSDTKKLAEKLSTFVKPRTIFCLSGKMGSGKTTLVRYMINSISNKRIKVLSPTFSIVNIYKFKKVKIWHFDLFRLKNKEEIFNLDFDLALMDCVIVEWPEIIKDLMPKSRIDIFLYEDENLLRKARVKITDEK